MRIKPTLAAAAAVWWLTPAPALAATDDCPEAFVCASRPEGVVKTLQALGYKAELGKSDTTGNPKIDSATAGYNYTIYFYGCEKAAACTSLQFMISFSKDSTNSAALANEWNYDKRFSAMAYDVKDGTLSISYDVTTVGGLTQPNFADVVDWWSTMMGEASKFFKEHPEPKKK